MPTDLTGTPTSLGIGTFNVDADAPSGLGFNEAMAQIDALIASRLATPAGIVSGEVPVWNGSTWVRSSVTGMAPSGLSGYPSDITKTLHGDGSWKSDEILYSTASGTISVSSVVSTSPTTIIAGTSIAYDGNPIMAEIMIPGATPAATAGNILVIGIWEGTSPLHYAWVTDPGGASGFQMPFFLKTRFTPSAGNHTYFVGGYVTNTAGSVTGAGDLMSLRITRANT